MQFVKTLGILLMLPSLILLPLLLGSSVGTCFFFLYFQNIYCANALFDVTLCCPVDFNWMKRQDICFFYKKKLSGIARLEFKTGEKHRRFLARGFLLFVKTVITTCRTNVAMGKTA